MREFVRLTRCIIAGIALAIISGLNCGEGSAKSSAAQTEERGRWTTLDWLQQLNYSHELHNVSTEDGYQLQLQRLPRVGGRPVLLVHGLMSSSLGWVCLGVDKSLAFQLHRRNYDVWLANLRGVTPYGRQHLELTDVMTQFWRYSFHEHGAYDLPAIIDHIVEQKQREKQQGQGEEREQAKEEQDREQAKEEEQDRDQEKEEQAKEEQDTDQDREQAKEELEPSAEQAANAEPEQTEERAQPEQEAAGPTQEELHQVLLIGHSQAFNAFLVLCSLHPRFNQHILLMQALAPIARLHHKVRFDNTQVRAIMRFVKKRQKANKYELFPPGELRRICQKRRELCEYYTKTFAGSSQSNRKLLEIFNYDYLLQGGSARELQHLQQIWKSGDFIEFDYGPIENLQFYRSVEPLAYNLSNIRVPIVLYFGETDAIATPEGVHDIYARMLSTVRSVRRIAASKFNHFDFLLSGEVKTLVNDKLIELMEKFLAGKLPYIIE